MVKIILQPASQDENNHYIILNVVNNIVKINFTKIQHKICFNKLFYSHASMVKQPIFSGTIRLLNDTGVMHTLTKPVLPVILNGV